MRISPPPNIDRIWQEMAQYLIKRNYNFLCQKQAAPAKAGREIGYPAELSKFACILNGCGVEKMLLLIQDGEP